MSTELVKVAVPSLAMSEQELISVLGASIYPGAKVESIKLVISYCKARQLDPLQKPVHIVPMSVKVGKRPNGDDEYEMRDVVMPGVGLYRTDAARTGLYAGKTEPEFGPDKQFKKDEFTMTFPEWCRITVYRMVNGERVGFTAKELWIENYATAGRNTSMPNAMWKKRPYAQLAKCTEAQALRMAFPEAVGAEPTADEMEGKTIDADVISETPKIEAPKSKSNSASPAVPAPSLSSANTPPDGGGTGTQSAAPASGNAQTTAVTGTAPSGEAPDQAPLSDGQKRILRARMESAQVTDEQVKKQFGRPLAELAASQFQNVQAWVREMSEARQ